VAEEALAGEAASSLEPEEKRGPVKESRLCL
jgi:hypothetical protein